MHRLKSEREFARLARSRKSGYAKSVGVKVRENTLPYSRFGVVVGLKISKKAVDRNRLKRQLREIMRKHLGATKPSFDIMVLVQKSAVEASYEELEADYLKAMMKVGLIEKA